MFNYVSLIVGLLVGIMQACWSLHVNLKGWEFKFSRSPEGKWVGNSFCSLVDPEEKAIHFWIDKLLLQAVYDSAALGREVSPFEEGKFMARHEMRHVWQFNECGMDAHWADCRKPYIRQYREVDANRFAFGQPVESAEVVRTRMMAS